MKEKFQNLTLDFRQLRGIPIQDRVTLARSPDASLIFGNMTPTEIAKLFPTYYQQHNSAVAGLTNKMGNALSNGGQTQGSGGGGSPGSGSGSTGQSTASPAAPLTLAENIAQAANAKKFGTNIPAGQRRLMELIASGEGGYNSSNGGTSGGNIIYSSHNTVRNGKKLEQMTIGEIEEYMKLPVGNPERLFAVGKYQLTKNGAWPGAVKYLGLKSTDVLTPEVQEKMGLYAVMEKRPAVGRFIRGETDDILTAQKQLALEFASIPVPVDMEVEGHGYRKAGSSAYGAGNAASHSIQSVRDALLAAKEDYAKIDQSAQPQTGTNETDQNGSDVGRIDLPTADKANDPIVRITPENISSVEGLDPRIIDYIKSLNEAERTQFYENLNIIGNIDDINRQAKASLGNITDTKQSLANTATPVIPNPYGELPGGSSAMKHSDDVKGVVFHKSPLTLEQLQKGEDSRGSSYGYNTAIVSVYQDPDGNVLSESDWKKLPDEQKPRYQEKAQVHQLRAENVRPNQMKGSDSSARSQYGRELNNTNALGIVTLGNDSIVKQQAAQEYLAGLIADDKISSQSLSSVYGHGEVQPDEGRADMDPGGAPEGSLMANSVRQNTANIIQRAEDIKKQKLAKTTVDTSATPQVAESPHTQVMPDGSVVDTGRVELPTAETPKEKAPEVPPAMALGGFIPQQDNLEVKNENTGETVAKINEGELKGGIKEEGSGLRVEANHTRVADGLVSKYEQKATQPEPEQQSQPVPVQSSMTSQAAQSSDRIGYLPYQTPSDIVHSSLLRAYDLNRNRTNFGGL